MATRMKLMKMLQETRSLTEFMSRRPHHRAVAPMLLQVRAPKWKVTRNEGKRLLPVLMKGAVDFPEAVPIRFIAPVA